MTEPSVRLIVMRHAKAEGAASNDHSRRLTDRGVRDAVAAGRWLADKDITPDLVLVSSAARARSTFDCVAVGLGRSPDMRVMDELYGADVSEVLESCAVVPEDASCAMVIGHNPTMEQVVQTLQQDDSGEPAALPTSGIAVLDCAAAWDSLSPGSGTVGELYAPQRR